VTEEGDPIQNSTKDLGMVDFDNLADEVNEHVPVGRWRLERWELVRQCTDAKALVM